MAAKKKMNVWIAQHLAMAGTVAAVFILLIGYLALFRPELGRIRAANRLTVLQQELDLKQQYAGRLSTLEKNFRELPKEDVARLFAMIPASQDIPGLLAAFEASANASSLSLTSINFARGEKPAGLAALAGLESMNIALALENGDYAHFKLFLEALEQNLRLFDVAGVTLNPAGAQYTLIIRAYVRAAAA